VGRGHGHQALDAGERHGAVLAGAHQAAADAVLAAVLARRGEHAVGPEALHRRGHAACGGRGAQTGALPQGLKASSYEHYHASVSAGLNVLPRGHLSTGLNAYHETMRRTSHKHQHKSTNVLVGIIRT